MLSSFEMLFYTLVFIVPGFIMYCAVSTIVPKKKEEANVSFIRFLLFSCINYAIWSWLIYYIAKNDLAEENPLIASLIWGFIILISPLIIGLVIGINSRKETIRKILQAVGYNPIHPIPTAWDFKFCNITEGSWVIVTLKDDSIVAGLFGKDSFASSDYEERDIYIERVYRIQADGTWVEVQRSEGILICNKQIKHIEFFK